MRTSVPSWKHCDAARYPYLYKIPFYFRLKWRRNYKDVANFLINRILASRISHTELTHLVSEFCTAHNLYNVECRPTNIISQHLQLKFIGKGVSNQTLPLIHFSHIEEKYNPLSHELDAVLLNLFVHPIKVPLKMVGWSWCTNSEYLHMSVCSQHLPWQPGSPASTLVWSHLYIPLCTWPTISCENQFNE